FRGGNQIVETVSVGQQVLDDQHDDLDRNTERVGAEYQLADRQAVVPRVHQGNAVLEHRLFLFFQIQHFGQDITGNDQYRDEQSQVDQQLCQERYINFSMIYIYEDRCRHETVCHQVCNRSQSELELLLKQHPDSQQTENRYDHINIDKAHIAQYTSSHSYIICYPYYITG